MPIGTLQEEHLLPFFIAPALAGDITDDEEVASIYALKLWEEQ